MTDFSNPSVSEPLIAVEESRPSERLPPGEWVRRNLFGGVGSTAVTVVFGLLGLYIAYRSFRFVFITGQWSAVTTNLTLFMQGTYPRDEQWRLVAQIILLACAIGLAAGAASAASRDAAIEAELEHVRSSPTDLARRFWPLLLVVFVLLVSAKTVGPWALALLGIVAGIVAFLIARALPRSLRGVTWVVAAIVVIGAFQVVIGTVGSAWWPLGLVLAGCAWVSIDRFALDGPADLLARVAAAVVVALIVRTIYGFFELEGVGWDDWSGLHLTLFLAVSAIVLAFPVGLLLALARRSTLPALRVMATIYIELIRGVPLISLLLMGQFFLGFFLGSDVSLAEVTRAIVAMTLFSAAYVAEIVRGGLQALPKGQTEAGQALGLSPPKIMRLIVLPQALRAVIPAMVGQFIALFKDTTLVTIIGLTEVLNARELVHAQAEFRGQGIAETFVFVAFIYWAFSYSMSRESRRLERKLGVGTR